VKRMYNMEATYDWIETLLLRPLQDKGYQEDQEDYYIPIRSIFVVTKPALPSTIL
jgi:hypothetical protein